MGRRRNLSRGDVEREIKDAFVHARSVDEQPEIDKARKARNWDAISKRLQHPDSTKTTLSPRKGRGLSKSGAGAAAAAAVVVAGYGVYALVGRAVFTTESRTHPPAQHVHSTATSKHRPSRNSVTYPGYGVGAMGIPVPSKVTDLYSSSVGGSVPFCDVSPDGNWVIEANSKNNGFLLESVDGKVKQNIHSAANVIYGETPTGDLVLGVNAGGGGVVEVMNPTTGAVTPIPGNMDRAAHWAYRAQQGVNGDWAVTMANRNGAGPGQQIWVDVNGKKVAGLNAAFDYSWSPDGKRLAVLVPPPPGAKTVSPGMLDLYDPSTGKITRLAGANAVSPAPSSTTGGDLTDSVGPMWSPDGRYILYADGANPGIVDAQTGTIIHLPVKQVGSMGFLTNGDIFVVTGAALNTVNFYSVKGNQLTPAGIFIFAGQVDQVAPAGFGLLVGRHTASSSSSGSNAASKLRWVSPIIGHTARAAMVWQSPVDSWWYDSVTQLVYLHPARNGGKTMSTVVLPTAVSGGTTTSNAVGGQP